MQVGVNILNFGPGSSPDALLRWAQVSEALGVHSIMISDHVAITPSVATRYPEPYWDVFASLSWLAGQTRRLQLGTTVVVLPYRHPVLTARLVSNIDVMPTVLDWAGVPVPDGVEGVSFARELRGERQPPRHEV